MMGYEYLGIGNFKQEMPKALGFATYLKIIYIQGNLRLIQEKWYSNLHLCKTVTFYTFT